MFQLVGWDDGELDVQPVRGLDEGEGHGIAQLQEEHLRLAGGYRVAKEQPGTCMGKEGRSPVRRQLLRNGKGLNRGGGARGGKGRREEGGMKEGQRRGEGGRKEG